MLCYTWPTIGYKWVAIPMHYHSRYQLNPYHHRAYPRRANATSFSVCCYSHVKLLHLIYTAVETPTDLRYILRNARGRGTGYSLRTSAVQVYGTLLHEESPRYSEHPWVCSRLQPYKICKVDEISHDLSGNPVDIALFSRQLVSKHLTTANTVL